MPAAPVTLIQVVQIAVFAVLIGGALAAWARISIRLASGQSILAAEPRRPVPWNLGHVVAIAAVYFLLQAGGAMIVHEFFPAPPAAVEVLALAANDPESPDKEKEVPEKSPKDTGEKVAAIDPRNMAAGILSHMIASLLTLAIALSLLRATTGCTWTDLGVVPDKFLNDIQLGLAGFAAAAVPIYGLQFALSRWSTKRHPIIDWLEKSPDADFLLLAGISTVLIAPLAEEFFFRLTFQGWLENIVSYLWPKSNGEPNHIEDESGLESLAAISPSDNPYAPPRESSDFVADAARIGLVPPGGLASWGPIITSALIFALMHFDHGPAPIPLFFLALLLGYLYLQTHRILPSIVVHCCLNSCSMLILWTTLWK